MVLGNKNIHQRDAWLGIGFLFFIPIFYALVIFQLVERIFPELSPHLLDYIFIIFSETLVLAYYIAQFGRIEMTELLPHHWDYIVLVFAIVIQFWIFGLRFGHEGLNSETHESIRDLPTTQYWWAVVIIMWFAPLLEETIFRRYFFEILRQHYPISIAALFTAGVATLFHWESSLSSWLWVFFDQLFFTVVYVKSRLGVAVLVHAFVNALVLFLSR